MDQRTNPQGVPCWSDTEQPDVDAAAGFHGGLFGWTFEDATPPGAPGRYLTAKLNGQDAAAWNTYIAVDDADASAQRLDSAGARML